MTSEDHQEARSQDFNPQEPFVDEKGYEYDNLGAFIAGRKKANGRNQKIEDFWRWESRRARQNSPLDTGQDRIHDYLWSYYTNYSEKGDLLTSKGHEYEEHVEDRRSHIPRLAFRFREGAERYRIRLRIAGGASIPAPI